LVNLLFYNAVEKIPSTLIGGAEIDRDTGPGRGGRPECATTPTPGGTVPASIANTVTNIWLKDSADPDRVLGYDVNEELPIDPGSRCGSTEKLARLSDSARACEPAIGGRRRLRFSFSKRACFLLKDSEPRADTCHDDPHRGASLC
jgi:hypothetical protein